MSANGRWHPSIGSIVWTIDFFSNDDVLSRDYLEPDMILSSSFVQEQIDGARSYAAVLRVGLGPTTPPLCRCAACTADLLSYTWWVISRYVPTLFAALVLGMEGVAA